MALGLHSHTCSITYNMAWWIATLPLSRWCVFATLHKIAQVSDCHYPVSHGNSNCQGPPHMGHAILAHVGAWKELFSRIWQSAAFVNWKQSSQPRGRSVFRDQCDINCGTIILCRRWNRAFLFRSSIAEMTSEPWTTIVLLFCDLWELLLELDYSNMLFVCDLWVLLLRPILK